MSGHTKWSEIKRQKAERTTFLATVEEDGPVWFVKVPGKQGLHAQSTSLGDAEAAIRGAIALMREIPTDSFDVIVTRVDASLADDLR